MPSTDPAQAPPPDAHPAATQAYQYPPVQPDGAWSMPPVPGPAAAKSAKRQRTIGLVVGIIVALVVFGIVTALLSSNKPNSAGTASIPLSTTTSAIAEGSSASASSPAPATSAAAPAIKLPSGAAGLVLLNTSQAQAEAARVRQGVETSAVYKNSFIGAYGKSANSDYAMVLVVQPFTNLSAADAANFATVSPLDAVSMIVNGANMKDVTVESPSDPAAAMSCGTLTAAGVSVVTCVWDDARGFGLGYFYPTYTTTSKADAARYTDALRAAAENG